MPAQAKFIELYFVLFSQAGKQTQDLFMIFVYFTAFYH